MAGPQHKKILPPRDRFFSWLGSFIAAVKYRGLVHAFLVLYYTARLRLTREPNAAGSCSLFGFTFHYQNVESAVHLLFEQFGENVYYFHADSENPTIVDFGANVGDSVLYFKQLYPEACVLSFEPSSQAFVLLQKNVDANRLANVQCFPFGVGCEDRTATLYNDSTGTYLLGSTSEGLVRGAVETGSIKTETVTIRRAVEVVELKDLSRIDMLKMDVEGAELEILRNLEPMLGKIQNVVLEYHLATASNNSFDEIYDLLTGSGFRVGISASYRNVKGLANENVFFIHATRSSNA